MVVRSHTEAPISLEDWLGHRLGLGSAAKWRVAGKVKVGYGHWVSRGARLAGVGL